MVMSNLEMPRLKDRKRLPENTPDLEDDPCTHARPLVGIHVPYPSFLDICELSDVNPNS